MLRRRLRALVELQPARPAWAAGLRAALATIVPLLVAQAFDLPAATWASLAGYSAVLVDKGGAYRVRAIAMLAFLAAAAAGAFFGTLAAGRLVAIPAMLLVGLLAGLALAFGSAASSVGLCASIVFVVAIGSPGSLDQAWLRLAGTIAGGAWAMLVTLVVWPLSPNAPARRAVAGCWDLLAILADDAVHRRESDPLRPISGRVRSALENARAVLGATRRGRGGTSRRGERLVVLLELCDQVFGTLVALRETLAPGDPAILLAAASRAAGSIAERVKSPSTPIELADPLAGVPHANPLERRLFEELEAAWLIADGLRTDAPVPRLPGLAPMTRGPGPGVTERLRAALNLKSRVGRHAVRVGLTTALAVALGDLLHLSHNYWLTLTALVVLQPSTAATWVRAAQRIGGTMAGAGVAAMLLAGLHDSHLMLAVVAVLVFCVLAVQPLNYAVFALAVTPTFVLLAETGARVPHLPIVRLENTALGGLLALASSFLVFPTSARRQFPTELASALRALAAFASSASNTRRDPAAIRRDKRLFGLRALDAEAAFQPLLADFRLSTAAVEAGIGALAYLRRLAAAFTARAAEPPSAPSAAVGRTAARDLEALAAALSAGAPLPPAPQAPTEASPLDARIAVELGVLGSTLARLRAANASG